MLPGTEAAGDDSRSIVVEGVVERIVYESDDTGFLVARLQEEGKQNLTTFVGTVMAVSPGETVRLNGHWEENPRFGKQLRVEQYETILPATVQGIEKYLGSGLVKGVGPVYAKRLVDAFGVETLRVIDEEPHRLRRVEGIGKKRADQIRRAWEEQKAIQSIMMFLQGHGIGVGQAVRIYKQYGDGAVAVIRDNPYRLADDVAGIGFKGADTIAAELGVEKDAPQRLQAGIRYTLRASAGEGHAFQKRGALLRDAASLLEVDTERLEGPLDRLLEEQQIIAEGDAVYTRELYEHETGCDRYLKRLMTAPSQEVPIQVEKAIQWVEKTQSITLAEEQREAVRMACREKVFVVTGGPGTGKTTIINGLIAIFTYKKLSVQLAAPTGRAAKRMEDATDREAMTLHRLLEYSPRHGAFTHDENNPLAGDMFIVDECSMIDLPLMHGLLKAIPPHARLCLVGDVDQLPSVGPGTVLMDTIASGVVPTTRLKTVFRQAAQSGIIANAHRINTGQEPNFNTEDFFLIERSDAHKAVETILELVTERMPKKFGLDPLGDIQVLAPMHRGAAGVANLNEVLQQALNADGAPVPRKSFRIGDKVMQMRNNYELDVYNGDTGIVHAVHDDDEEVEIRFVDRAVLYPFDALDNLNLAYAATIHKSQGSEYPAVVIPLLSQHFPMLQRNVLYTAVTRGKRLVIIVGTAKAVRQAVHNTESTRRNTRLAERLRNAA